MLRARVNGESNTHTTQAQRVSDTTGYSLACHPKQVGEVARQAGANHLVLTHLQPNTSKEQLLNDATVSFPYKITMAADQMRLVL